MRVARGRFQEWPGDGRTLAARDGQPLTFDPRARLRPGAEFLEWHGRHHRYDTGVA